MCKEDETAISKEKYILALSLIAEKKFERNMNFLISLKRYKIVRTKL